jgi:hypothetical protein
MQSALSEEFPDFVLEPVAVGGQPAASIVALSTSRLVWPAMVLISSTTSPIRVAASESSLTREECGFHVQGSTG